MVRTPPGTELDKLKRWLPQGVLEETPDPAPTPTKTAEKGIALTELLGKVREVIDEGIPTAVWVRGEVSELRGKNGQLYLTLCERNQSRDILAQAKGIIWKNRAENRTAKLEEATGEGLKTDIKILCLAKVRFDPLYGLDLIIEDVDPSYTLGDLAATLARIREHLLATGLYERNKQLPAPVEFTRVAVISPETSAGLGDFKRESDLLRHSGLCVFHLFPATFQGVEAPSSIQTAIFEALAAHKQKPFDALVVIRGGGSVTDLAWLNDMDLAKLICQSPVPVFTGIGHERDNTILDEIAHTRFDTPSKVALHISTTIKDNALVAIQAWERINVLVGRIINKEKTMLATQADRIGTGVRSVIRRVEAEQEGCIKLIQTATTAQVREATIALDTQQGRVIDGAEKALCDAELDLAHRFETITQKCQLQLASERAEIERLVHTVNLVTQGWLDTAGRELSQTRKQIAKDASRMIRDAGTGLTHRFETIAQQARTQVEAEKSEVDNLLQTITLKIEGRLDAAGHDLDQIKTQVGRDADRMMTKAEDELGKSLALIENGVINVTDDARKDIGNFARIVVGLGPQSTLQRGFAIARDNNDKPVTSREAAMSHDTFQVQFRDGRVAVKNTDRSGGDER